MNEKTNTHATLHRVLTFTLAGEFFALDIYAVREILDVSEITRIPQAPEFMLGVVNLRGNAVPVMDLRQRFGLPRAERTVNSRIIIMEQAQEDGSQQLIGALADSVKEVLELDASQVDPPPRMGTRVPIDFITGIGKHNNKFVILLDAAKVFSVESLTQVQSVMAES